MREEDNTSMICTVLLVLYVAKSTDQSCVLLYDSQAANISYVCIIPLYGSLILKMVELPMNYVS